MGGLAVLCDFDGTITTVDTAEQVLARFAQGDWLELDRQLERGEITLEECMKAQFAMVHVPEMTILQALDQVVEYRPHFPELVAACGTGAIDITVVSAGLDFVIRHFILKLGLDARLSVYAGYSHFTGRHIDFTFPPLADPESRNFKDDFVRQQKQAGKKVVYIGDGLSDLEPAKGADFVFAVKGRRLSRLCETGHLRHIDFLDFRDIAWRVARCIEEGDECHLVAAPER
jgi:2-hydroxy-3-keto-5-methylthiopentenyl-1-phosphate phosphatase